MSNNVHNDYGTMDIDKLASDPSPSSDENKKCGTCRKFGCELSIFGVVVFVIIIGTLTGGAIAVSQLATKTFTKNQDCVTCIRERGFVFRGETNSSNATCLVNVSVSDFEQNASKNFETCPECVADAEFCGAPECRNNQLFPGVGLRLTPYWIVLLSAVFSVMLSAIVNALKIYVVRPFKKRFCCEFEDDLDNLHTDEERRAYVALNIAGATNFWLYAALYLFAISHYVFIIYAIVKYHDSLSGWDRFLVIHAAWMNSGTVEVLGILYCQGATLAAAEVYLKQFDQKDNQILKRVTKSIAYPWVTSDIVDRRVLNAFDDERIEDRHKRIAVRLMIPIFAPWLVMVFPMWIVFIPLTLAVFAVWIVVPGLFTAFFLRSPAIIFVARTVGTFCVLLLFQTGCNYSVLFYGGTNWVDTIRNEFAMRSTKCWFNAQVNSMQAVNLEMNSQLMRLSLAGLIFS